MDAITTLTAKLTNPKISVHDKLIEICQRTHQLIEGSDRVSLWVFSKDFNKITSILCYDSTSGSFTSGHELTREDYNDYFDAILNKDVIYAPQARENLFTLCFNETYFEPLNIYSLLDFILHKDFEPIGIICCESIGKETQWTDDDIEILRRISNISSFYFQVNS